VKHWIGIDPGQTGGLAYLDGNGVLLDVAPMPAIDKEVQAGLLAQILQLWMSDSDVATFSVAIEQVGSMPGQGVSSTFKFGKSFGIALGVVGALGVPMVRIRPQSWKKTMGLSGKDKAASLALANELWPSHGVHWKLKKNDGLSDAALIAEAARRTL
jgi:crossover junction endodeoxyribonuclease RuvC